MQRLLCAIEKLQARFRVAVLMILATLLSCSSLVSAQLADATPDSPAPAPAEAPAPVPAEPVVPAPAPAPVVDPAPAKDDSVGVPVVPPVVPVVVVAPVETTAPSTDVNIGEAEDDPAETTGNDPGGLTPTEISTETPTAVPNTPAPTIASTPTPTPTSISWNQPNPITCISRTGDAGSLALDDTATWRCEAAIQAEVIGDVPSDLAIHWTINASYAGDDVRFSLPEGSLATVQQPDALPGGTSEKVIYRSNWTDGQKLVFDVTVTRTSCVVGEAELRLNTDIEIMTADTNVQVSRAGEKPLETKLASVAAENGEPTIRFDGPITFESLSATSAGLESPISRGTAEVIIDGEWNPCSTWTVQINGSVEVDTAEPAQLRVVSINQEVLPGGACDLGVECDVITLPATGSAATPLRYTVGLELELNQFTPVGKVGITVNADLAGVETQP